MFELKPDFEKVLDRCEAWWNCQIVDRPLVSLSVPRPLAEQRPWPRKHHASIRERWLDTEYVVETQSIALRNQLFLGDSLPVTFPNLGPEVFSAFYGCEMEYGEDTGWSKPILHDMSEASMARLKLDKGSFYFRKVLEIMDAMMEAGRGVFLVGYTDLHGGGDALAAFRDPQELLLDTIESPAAIKALCDRITGDFLQVYDLYHERIMAAGMTSTTWCPMTCKGKFHIPSNDFSCMISGEAFEDLFMESIIRECRHMDRNLYHLDGPQALRFLDRLLDIPEIHAIQWVPGAGHDYWAEWIPVYQRIQERGKAMQINYVPVEDLPRLFSVLKPEGVWLNGVGGVATPEQAESVLQLVSTWTGKRS